MTENELRRPEKGVTMSQVFGALSHPTRRRILATMREQNSPGEDELETVEFLPRGEPGDRIEIQLRHKHLPHLDEAEFIDWDRETDTITRGPRFEEIEPLLELMDDHQDELPADWP